MPCIPKDPRAPDALFCLLRPGRRFCSEGGGWARKRWGKSSDLRSRRPWHRRHHLEGFGQWSADMVLNEPGVRIGIEAVMHGPRSELRRVG